MIVALTIASAMYVWQMMRHGSHITPDGQYYLACGRGLRVPAPYAYRVLPEYIRSLAGWRVVHAVSYLALSASVYVAVGFVSPAHAMPAVLILAALPTVRMSISWPVLLDMPSWAVIAATVAVAQSNPVAAICVASVGILVTEKTTPLAVLAAMPWMGLDCAIGAMAAWVVGVGMIFVTSDPAPADQDWLKRPLCTALEHHKNSSAVNWLMPWGGLVLALPALNGWGWLAVIAAYGQCIIAQDRARLYTAAALPLIIAMTSLDPVVMWAAAVITFFTPSTEV